MEDTIFKNYHQKLGRVTILFPDYYNPIWDLYCIMKSKPGRKDGYPQSIILLCDALLESFLVRLMYDNDPSKKNLEKFFKKYCQDNNIESIYLDYKEIAFVRNCIAHNHVWFVEQYIDNDSLDYIESSCKKIFGHDSEFLDIRTGRTKNNQLNTVPDKVSILDINIILKLVVKILRQVYEIERLIGHRSLWPDASALKHKGKIYSFAELIDEFVE